MPPQGEREREREGWVVTDFPNPTTIHCHQSSRLFSFVKKP
jgi:hypothetical protein